MSVELAFHGFAFIMSVSTVDDNLVINAEEKETGDRCVPPAHAPPYSPGSAGGGRALPAARFELRKGHGRTYCRAV